MLAILREIVLEAGAALHEASHDDLGIEYKGRVDLVTRVDRDLQRLLLDRLARDFSGERVVAEEQARQEVAAADGPVWYVDPLDGTTNFVHGHPFHAISVARWCGDRAEVAGVYSPALDELFLAEAGGGATLERPRAGVAARRLHVRDCPALDEALLATGFPYVRGATARLNLAICAHALSRARGLRRGGSAALDLCYVAAGRLDAYWELGLAPWDVAAGTLIAREAGAVVSDFVGRGRVLDGRRICASTPGVHRDLLALIASAHAHPEMDVLSAPLPPGVPLEGPLPGEIAGEVER